MTKYFMVIIALIMLVGPAISMAQVDVSTDVSKSGSMQDHSQMGHESMGHSSKSTPDMSILKTVPASGKAREAGFDNSYIMKQMTNGASIKTQCALASRGIIMLDRESWKKCGKQAP